MFHKEPTPFSLNKNVTLILATPVSQIEILYQSKIRVIATTVANQLACENKKYLIITTILCCPLSKNNRSSEKGWVRLYPG